MRRLTTRAIEVTDVAFSPDGTHILAAGGAGTVRLRPAHYHDSIRCLDGVLARDLTPDERARYCIADDGSAGRDQ